jgi:hypothetical protein
LTFVLLRWGMGGGQVDIGDLAPVLLNGYLRTLDISRNKRVTGRMPSPPWPVACFLNADAHVCR